MRLSSAWKYVLCLGLMGCTSDAFMFPPLRAAFQLQLPRQSIKLNVGNFARGWENDDFLDSLSKPQEQLPVVDELDGTLEGTIPPVQPYRGEHDDSQGGSKFKAMMEAAAQRAKAGNIPSRESPPVNPYAANPFIPPANAKSLPPQTRIDPAELEQLSVEEQAALFRQMMQQSQSAEQQTYEPPRRGPPTMVGGVDAKGRKIGRNRDTDTIANTSDLYFAQLKRDSAVRNMARIQGDEEFANQVFADPSVKQLEEELQKNPYLQREKEENRDMVKAVAQEMKQAQIRQAANQLDAGDTGPKYRKMMATKKTSKTPSIAASTVEPSAAVPVPAPVPMQIPIPTPMQEVESVVAQDPDPTPEPEPEPVVVAQVPNPAPMSKPSVLAEPAEETEDTKNKIRKLQGLLLKHRGGPGFGSGLLRGNEVQQFEETLISVGAQLRADAGPRKAATSAAPAQQEVAMADPPPAPLPVAPAVPSPAPMPAAPPLFAVTDRPPLITPPPRPDTSALTSFTPSSVDPRLEGSIACVEGALQMYKNCPPEIQQGMLMALRAALLAAANSCQQVIEGSMDQSTSYTPSPPVNTAAATAQDATIEEPGEENEQQNPILFAQDSIAPVQPQISSAMPTGNDSNSVLLRKVYDSLQQSSGEGKFGLGTISSDEAADLADLVKEMRMCLMEELDSGIPEDDVSPPTPSSTSSSGSVLNGGGGTASTYQQMLAKARATKKSF